MTEQTQGIAVMQKGPYSVYFGEKGFAFCKKQWTWCGKRKTTCDIILDGKVVTLNDMNDETLRGMTQTFFATNDSDNKD
jgi:hypothetical protein